ncbi:WASH complex subunit 4-like [Anopheles albimanus]|uniref:WASH complex subunit 7 n=1 Tax=Anopheles albimanus TaxID=7167 RepID=A0A182FNQ0_ANOAL|nr:WASH complex subunit 4-like [Anopheles albimanus]
MESLVSSSQICAAQIKEYGHFLKEYDQTLNRLQLATPGPAPVPSIVRLEYPCGDEKLSTARMIECSHGTHGTKTTLTGGAAAGSNVPLNKILATFAQLCREIDCLQCEIRSLARTIYERTERIRGEHGDSRLPLLWIAQNIDLMATVQCHFERLRDVGVLLLRQIGAFFDEEAAYGRGTKGRSSKKNGVDGKCPPSLDVEYLFDYLGKLLRAAHELDHILRKTSLVTHWRAFSAKLCQPAINQRSQSKAGFRDLLSICQSLGFWIGDETVPETTGLKRILEALYKVKTKFDPVCSGEAFSDRFIRFLKRRLTALMANLRNATVGVDFGQTNGVIGANLLLNFALHLFLPIEQRMMKNLVELNVKFPLIPLEDNYPWLPDEFVREQGHKLLRDFDASSAPTPVSTPIAAATFDYRKARDSQLQQLEKSATAATLCLHASSWLIEAHVQLRFRAYSATGSTGSESSEAANFTLESLRMKCNLLLEGIRLIRDMEYVLRALYALYGERPSDQTDRLILHHRMVVEFLLCSTRRSIIVPCLQFIVQHQQHKIYTIISSAKKKLLREAKETKSTASGSLWLEKLATIDVLEKCLHGPATPDRIGLARLTVALCHGDAAGGSSSSALLLLLPLSDDAYRKVCSLLDRLATLIDWETECSRSNVATRLLRFAGSALANRLASPTNVVPMSNRIETFIRWDFHGKCQQIEPFDPFRDPSDAASGGGDHAQRLVFGFLRTKLLLEVLMGERKEEWFSARHAVGQHLSDVFYTLSTISPSEWRIYREMRTIVDRKYGVRLVDDQLPRTTAEDRRGPRGHGQDDDILALMEDFESFIGSYGYDLHGQLFIERQQGRSGGGTGPGAGGGPGGVVNVVKIEHIANSIKRHGPGIISTVVNYAFQFLRQKLFTFSHFLYDEQIQSRLVADAKKLLATSDSAEGATASANTVGYTYERALAFNRRIRQLGLSDDGESYIDLFRKLICHIGNAMAFVRLLHSGALHECTGAAEFLAPPALTTKGDDDEQQQESGQGEAPAIGIWRQDVATVRGSWRLENEFFRLLINAFEGLRRRRRASGTGTETPANAPVDSFAHLELFYLIIPPLTISYVEAMLKAKETIAKKDRHGTFLPTDDGFVMGLSYLLTLLNQTAAFNSLHWFKEVRAKHTREMAKLNQQTTHLLQQPSDSAEEKMLPTVALTRKRLGAIQHEFQLLQYNLSSSKIFFK